ncbi:hypothetical protein N9Z48_01085 [Euryarchaeota archaeon]|nr:hypothetical protein [Euryarchaeota archaeon]
MVDQTFQQPRQKQWKQEPERYRALIIGERNNSSVIAENRLLADKARVLGRFAEMRLLVAVEGLA